MVDNAISDLLGVESAASPSSKQERKRKQAHWEGVQGQVTQVVNKIWLLKGLCQYMEAQTLAPRKCSFLTRARLGAGLETSPRACPGNGQSPQGIARRYCSTPQRSQQPCLSALRVRVHANLLACRLRLIAQMATCQPSLREQVRCGVHNRPCSMAPGISALIVHSLHKPFHESGVIKMS
eukprot:scaffold7077_cov18-Tisochrysis_lutea.AAC.1